MPGTLRELIVASELIHGGNQNADSGEGFRNNVNGAASLEGTRSYRLISATMGGGVPQPPGEAVYGPSDASFAMTLTVNRNANFWRIQRLLQSAWSVYTVGGNGTASVSITSFSWSGSPNGASLALTLTAKAPVTGSISVTGSASHVGGTPPNNNPTPVQFSLGVSGGGTGTQDFDIYADWIPCGGNFEFTQSFNWPVRFNFRAYDTSDIEIQWFDTASDRSNGTNVRTTSASYIPGASPPYPSNSGGTVGGESMTLYARWRFPSGSWTDVDVNFTDPRPPE